MQTYRTKVINIVSKYQSAFILGPEPYLCDEEKCYARINDKMLYAADDDHLSVMGSKYIASKMINQVVNLDD